MTSIDIARFSPPGTPDYAGATTTFLDPVLEDRGE